MLLKEFYRRVILTEEAALAFLREHNLLDTGQEADPCHKCGSVMQEKRKRNRGGDFKPVLRCYRKWCRTTRSVCTGNQIFHYTDINNKLHCNPSLCEISELIFLFVLDIPMSTAVVVKVVDIDPQGSIGPSKGSIKSHGVKRGHWMARGQWITAGVYCTNEASNSKLLSIAQGMQEAFSTNQTKEGWSNLSYSSLKAHSIRIVFYQIIHCDDIMKTVLFVMSQTIL